MTLRDDLIAARGLINTPEKYAKPPAYYRKGVLRTALWAVSDIGTSRGQRCELMLASLRKHLPAGVVSLAAYENDAAIAHADIMALFDRAIADAA